VFSVKRIRIFYLVAAGLCVASWLWLVCDNYGLLPQGTSVCLFKKVTGVPCPGCGTTRSVRAILHGHWRWSEIANPEGYAALLAIVLLPLWIIADLLRKQPSLQQYAVRADRFIRTRPLWTSIVFCLIIANWIWNIHKQL
jgi:hypothetical protein